MIRHHARVLGIVIVLVALWLGVAPVGLATRGAWAEAADNDAVAASRAAMRARPDYAVAYTHLGFALSGLERWDEARLTYEQVPGYFESGPIQGHAWEIVSRLRSPDAGAGSR